MVQPLWRTLWWCLKKLTEKAMATHSVLLAWKIPWMVEPGRLQSTGSRRVGHNWATSLSLSCTGEGNGNPFQCSHLENPRDGGAWWTAVYGVAQSRTQLKQLSSSSIKLNIEHCDPATPLPGINLNKLNTGFQTSTCTRVHSNAISEQQVILNSQLDSEIAQMSSNRWKETNCGTTTITQPCMYVCSLINNSLWPPWTTAHQAPLHRISQARTLEWVAISSFRETFWPRDRTHISYIGRQILYHWAIKRNSFSHERNEILIQDKVGELTVRQPDTGGHMENNCLMDMGECLGTRCRWSLPNTVNTIDLFT